MSGRARALQVLFTRLESASGPPSKDVELQEVLGQIVKGAHEFTMAADLTTALQSF